MKIETEQGEQFINIKIVDSSGEVIFDLKFKDTFDGTGGLLKADIDFADFVYVNGHHWLDAEVKDR
jgi:hypothetical protein